MNDKTFPHVERELAQFSAAILTEFQNAAPVVRNRLSSEDFIDWAEEGLTIAKLSFRTWEAASEYFKASTRVVERLSAVDLHSWAKQGEMLARESSVMASAYFRASSETLYYLPPQKLEDWVRIGKNLSRDTWRSNSLCSKFFESSPKLLRYLSFDDVEQFTAFLKNLAEISYDLCTDYLDMAKEVFPGIEKQDRKPFLDLAMLLSELNLEDTKAFFGQGPRLLSRIDQDERKRFLSIVSMLATSNGAQPFVFLFDGSQAMGELDRTIHSRILDMHQELFIISQTASVDFVKSAPYVVGRIGLSGLNHWFEEGRSTIERREESGEAFFRLESAIGDAIIERLSSRVELEQIREILRMYSRALTGRNTQMRSTEKLTEKGIGWTSVEMPSTEGTAIYLPPCIDRYDTKEQNFAWYKVVATHQAGHLEFDSFEFCFDTEASLFSNQRRQLDSEMNSSITDMERFFDLFADRRLATDIFAAVEDSRVDFLLKQEYAGIRRSYEQVQREALKQRPALQTMPLREALVEFIIQMSLGDVTSISFPAAFKRELRSVFQISNRVKSPQATVEDSAEATIRLYSILIQVTNVMYDGEWRLIELSDLALSDDALRIIFEGIPQAGIPEEDDVVYQSPPQVDYRGEFKPEIIQLLTKLKQDNSKNDAAPASPLSQEELKALVEKSVEIDLAAMLAGDIASSMGLFLSNIMDEIYQSPPCIAEDGTIIVDVEDDDDDGRSLDEELDFLYDEWDFRACDYKPRWCCVREKVPSQGSTDFFEDTLKNNARLAAQIKRQFELVSPELFKKIKKLRDGDDLDLDAVIEAMVEKKIGIPPCENIYWRRNKIERDVSVIFLLDISASTSEAIEESKNIMYDEWDFKDIKEYMAWLRAQTLERHKNQARKIIDVEKESLVLLMGALETIGDEYGIYGFSGHGRENVEFYVIKGINETFSDKVKKRIDGLTPLHATRMGPAIRHATSKLAAQSSRTKILFLISDGRPQDQGYGRDNKEKDYAINDTKMALIEAKRKGIVPFCLTVDKMGQDYLKKMCHDIGYEVVWDIESLPKRLPVLYRKLTT
ncbi:MAG: VWA domain-containing protein [Chloroflexota bacterium]|nr:VWA domain-containing protein [Chloroflexota bacterium]